MPTDCEVVVGKSYSFLYPRHNFEHIESYLEKRSVYVTAVRDLTSIPLDVTTRDRNRFVRRGQWLVTGQDLQKNSERSFYYESMIGLAEIDASQEADCVPMFLVGRQPFATQSEAEAAAGALARLKKKDVAVSIVNARFSARQMVKLIDAQCRRVQLRTPRRKSG